MFVLSRTVDASPARSCLDPGAIRFSSIAKLSEPPLKIAAPAQTIFPTGNPLKTFDQLKLVPEIQRAIAGENYETPTPIQAQTIPAALKGQDILGCAQTGTGKTAAFALPILNELAQQNERPIPECPDALILAPTRELAIQIGDSFKTYGKHLKIRHALVYGGVNQNSQVRALRQGVHVLVATPGRLLDLMNQGHVSLGELQIFVLDEADRMLDMGFLPDLKRIIKDLPDDRQSMFFSATLAPNIRKLSQQLLFNPLSVNVTPKTTSVERITQQVMFVDSKQKRELLHETIDGDDVDRVIVFTRTKRGANQVAEKLTRSGFSAAAIHGNKSQNARQRALDAFRRGDIQVLVATDVAARGIDIDGVSHVINYDMPVEPESYVHRIGRTGRAGAEGIAISFCTSAERSELRAIEKLIGQSIEAVGDDPRTQRRSRDGGDRPPRSGGSRPRRSNSSGSNASSESSSKSRRRRSPRKGRNERQRAKVE